MEDEAHFMLFCPVYKTLRDSMWETVEEILTIDRTQLTGDQQLNTLIGDGCQSHPQHTEVVKIVLKYIEKAMKERKRQGVKSE